MSTTIKGFWNLISNDNKTQSICVGYSRVFRIAATPTGNILEVWEREKDWIAIDSPKNPRLIAYIDDTLWLLDTNAILHSWYDDPKRARNQQWRTYGNWWLNIMGNSYPRSKMFAIEYSATSGWLQGYYLNTSFPKGKYKNQWFYIIEECVQLAEALDYKTFYIDKNANLIVCLSEDHPDNGCKDSKIIGHSAKKITGSPSELYFLDNIEGSVWKYAGSSPSFEDKWDLLGGFDMKDILWSDYNAKLYGIEKHSGTPMRYDFSESPMGNPEKIGAIPFTPSWRTMGTDNATGSNIYNAGDGNVYLFNEETKEVKEFIIEIP